MILIIFFFFFFFFTFFSTSPAYISSSNTYNINNLFSFSSLSSSYINNKKKYQLKSLENDLQYIFSSFNSSLISSINQNKENNIDNINNIEDNENNFNELINFLQHNIKNKNKNEIEKINQINNNIEIEDKEIIDNINIIENEKEDDVIINGLDITKLPLDHPIFLSLPLPSSTILNGYEKVSSHAYSLAVMKHLQWRRSLTPQQRERWIKLAREYELFSLSIDVLNNIDNNPLSSSSSTSLPLSSSTIISSPFDYNLDDYITQNQLKYLTLLQDKLKLLLKNKKISEKLNKNNKINLNNNNNDNNKKKNLFDKITLHINKMKEKINSNDINENISENKNNVKEIENEIINDTDNNDNDIEIDEEKEKLIRDYLSYTLTLNQLKEREENEAEDVVKLFYKHLNEHDQYNHPLSSTSTSSSTSSSHSHTSSPSSLSSFLNFKTGFSLYSLWLPSNSTELLLPGFSKVVGSYNIIKSFELWKIISSPFASIQHEILFSRSFGNIAVVLSKETIQLKDKNYKDRKKNEKNNYLFKSFFSSSSSSSSISSSHSPNSSETQAIRTLFGLTILRYSNKQWRILSHYSSRVRNNSFQYFNQIFPRPKSKNVQEMLKKEKDNKPPSTSTTSPSYPPSTTTAFSSPPLPSSLSSHPSSTSTTSSSSMPSFPQNIIEKIVKKINSTQESLGSFPLLSRTPIFSSFFNKSSTSSSLSPSPPISLTPLSSSTTSSIQLPRRFIWILRELEDKKQLSKEERKQIELKVLKKLSEDETVPPILSAVDFFFPIDNNSLIEKKVTSTSTSLFPSFASPSLSSSLLCYHTNKEDEIEDDINYQVFLLNIHQNPSKLKDFLQQCKIFLKS